MSGKKRQTFEKMNRERAVKEKRARKQEKKELKKLAALEPPVDDESLDESEVDGEPAVDGEPEPATT